MCDETGSSATPRQGKPLFQIEESRFTIALRDPVHNASFSLFLGLQSILLMITVVQYILDPAVFWSDMDFVIRAFSPIHVSLGLELVYILLSSLLIMAVRMEMQSADMRSRIFLIITVTLVLTVVLVAPVYVMLTMDPGLALGLSIMLHQVRILMKVSSFLVENLKRMDPSTSDNNNDDKSQDSEPLIGAAGAAFLDTNKKSDEREAQLPTQASMLYFLFAPTLIYQHSYPRSPGPISWTSVLVYLVQWLFVFVPGVHVFRHLKGSWDLIGHEALTPDNLASLAIHCTILAFGTVFSLGYLMFHCWLNMWAEVLRFGDRRFYGSWWTARNGRDYANNWNLVTRAWLVRYIYRPCLRRSRLTAIMAVSLASVVVHDVIISLLVGSILPLSLLLFVTTVIPPILSHLLTNPKGETQSAPPPSTGEEGLNMFLSHQILQLSLFALVMILEYHSRRSCPLPPDAGIAAYFLPRSFSCVSFDFQY